MTDPSIGDWLDALIFDTAAWGPMTEMEGLRCWKVGAAVLNVRYFEMEPDFERLDPEYLRETLTEAMGLVEAHGWPVESLEAVVSSATIPDVVPTQNILIEVVVDSIQGAPTVAATLRQIWEGQVRFGTMLVVLFATCCWSIRIEVDDSEPVGEREGAVFRAVLEGTATLEDAPMAIDPYERRWDGLIPVESDPLSRLRILMGDLVRSLRLGPVTADLEPFRGE